MRIPALIRDNWRCIVAGLGAGLIIGMILDAIVRYYVPL